MCYTLSELSLKSSTHLTVEELYSISLTIDIEPTEVLEDVCKHSKLEKQS